MKYKIYTDKQFGGKMVVGIRPDAEPLWIPLAEGNRDYQEYLAWVAEGNVAEPYNPEESAPTDKA